MTQALGSTKECVAICNGSLQCGMRWRVGCCEHENFPRQKNLEFPSNFGGVEAQIGSLGSLSSTPHWDALVGLWSCSGATPVMVGGLTKPQK